MDCRKLLHTSYILPPIAVSAEEFKRHLDKKEILNLVDVRTPREVEDFNLGGIHIPMDELLLRIDQIEHLQNQELILICGTGLLSGIAVKILTKKGFKHVHNLEGGIEAYLSL